MRRDKTKRPTSGMRLTSRRVRPLAVRLAEMKEHQDRLEARSEIQRLTSKLRNMKRRG